MAMHGSVAPLIYAATPGQIEDGALHYQTEPNTSTLALFMFGGNRPLTFQVTHSAMNTPQGVEEFAEIPGMSYITPQEPATRARGCRAVLQGSGQRIQGRLYKATFLDNTYGGTSDEGVVVAQVFDGPSPARGGLPFVDENGDTMADVILRASDWDISMLNKTYTISGYGSVRVVGVFEDITSLGSVP